MTKRMATELEKKIMRRVYVLWVARRAFNPLMLKLYFLAGLAFALEQLVSLRHVLANWPALGNVQGETAFLATAFLNTSHLTQAVTLAMAAIGVLLVRDLFSYEDAGQFSYQLPLRPLR